VREILREVGADADDSFERPSGGRTRGGDQSEYNEHRDQSAPGHLSSNTTVGLLESRSARQGRRRV
jgi:hypothetical protein